MGDFRDPCLFGADSGVLSRTVIAPLSEVVREVYGQEVLGFRDMLLHSHDVVRNMSVLRVIHSIDWNATFASSDVLHICSYLY